MASRTPHTIVFTDDQRGKTASVALAWQNERGIRGEARAAASKAAAYLFGKKNFRRYAV